LVTLMVTKNFREMLMGNKVRQNSGGFLYSDFLISFSLTLMLWWQQKL
jgi:hypothetical protein